MSSYTLSLVTLASIYVILALSLNLIMGLCGQVSLGHAAFYGIGAYICALLAKAGYGPLVTLPLATFGAGAVGFIVGGCSLRVRDNSLAIATMAVGLIFSGVVPQSDFLGGQIGIPNIPSPWTRTNLANVAVLSACVTAAFCVYVDRSWLGFAFRAVAADEQAGRMIGIDDGWYKVVAFAIGTAIAGFAGALFAYSLRTVGPEAFGVATSFSLLPMIILGGSGSVWGCILGAAVLTLFPEAFQFARDYKLLIFGVLLIAVILAMPEGFAGLGKRLVDVAVSDGPRPGRRVSDAVLAVEGVTLAFGGITALNDVSFEVARGEFVGLIGPNGAGKTSLLRTIMGAQKAQHGRVLLNGVDISKRKTAQRSRLGLAMSHQIVRPFRNMSVVENVMLAAGHPITRSPLSALLHWRKRGHRSEARARLDQVEIGAVSQLNPRTQPLGVLKRLEVARALALEPTLLLLDEPLAGLGHGETRGIADMLLGLNRQGVTVLLIEHNLVEARRICSRFVVLDNGRKIADGPSEAAIADPAVVSAYLGEGWKGA